MYTNIVTPPLISLSYASFHTILSVPLLILSYMVQTLEVFQLSKPPLASAPPLPRKGSAAASPALHLVPPTNFNQRRPPSESSAIGFVLPGPAHVVGASGPAHPSLSCRPALRTAQVRSSSAASSSHADLAA